MSATISLERPMAPQTALRFRDAMVRVLQHSLLIAGLMLVIGLVHLASVGVLSDAQPEAAGSPATFAAADVPLPQATAVVDDDAPALLPRMQGALEYVTRRYKVSPQALVPIFEAAQMIGSERRIDPLLIVAVIGVESGFNPYAESTFGAQGLMQIIPRFHMDKLPDGVSAAGFLDPVNNIRVGAQILEEAIRRRGGLIPGLQYYAGSSNPDDNAYASKVLAEKQRLEAAARRSAAATHG